MLVCCCWESSPVHGPVGAEGERERVVATDWT